MIALPWFTPPPKIAIPKNPRKGRPRHDIDMDRYKALRQAGLTVLACAATLGTSKPTLMRRQRG